MDWLAREADAMCNNHAYVSPYLRRKLRSYAETMREAGKRPSPATTPAPHSPEGERHPNECESANGDCAAGADKTRK